MQRKVHETKRGVRCYVRSLADDIGSVCPCAERLFELSVTVVVRRQVCVWIDVHVGVVSLGRSDGFLIQTQWRWLAWCASQLLHVTDTTHRYRIPDAAAAAAAQYQLLLLLLLLIYYFIVTTVTAVVTRGRKLMINRSTNGPQF